MSRNTILILLLSAVVVVVLEVLKSSAVGALKEAIKA